MSPLLTCSVVLGRPCSYSRCKHLVCLSNYCGVLHEGIGGGEERPRRGRLQHSTEGIGSVVQPQYQVLERAAASHKEMVSAHPRLLVAFVTPRPEFCRRPIASSCFGHHELL